MQLDKLFEMQRKLDEHIEREHPTQVGEDRLAKKILALQVELGELANEWRGFKYWSNDQEPRTSHNIFKHGIRLNPADNPINPLLEEYVDCLHFILSIGLEMETKKEWGHSFKIDNSIISQFHALFGELSSLFYHNEMYNYQRSFDLLIGLGEMLGFTWEEIKQAYMSKNKVNHQRQEDGY